MFTGMFGKIPLIKGLFSTSKQCSVEVERTTDNNTIHLKTNSVDRMTVLSTGEIGFPNAVVGRRMSVGGDMTGTTGGYGLLLGPTVKPDVTGNALLHAAQCNLDATTALSQVQIFRASQGVYADGSSVASQYGFYANALTSATANYGFFSNMNEATGVYNLYMSGTARNHLGGGLSIGTLNTTAGTNVNINKAITGAANTYNFNVNGSVQADVTGVCNNIYSRANIVAAAFTLPSYHHFVASQGTIGAGSSITTQTGFHVESTVTGATNNYGFRGLIASGTGRWNLYMDGTASNYIAGTVGIGTTSQTAKLEIKGSGDTSATTSLLVRSSASTELLKVTDDGQLTIQGLSTAKTTLDNGDSSSAIVVNVGGRQASTIVVTGANSTSGKFCPSLLLQRHRGSTPIAVSSGDYLGRVEFSGHDGTSYVHSALIASAVEATPTTENVPGRLMFFTTPSNATVPVERMRISSTGSFGFPSIVTGRNFSFGAQLTGTSECHGVFSYGSIQSDVTLRAILVSTQASTAAATFTLTDLIHYRARQSSFGAGSVVTNQYGYLVQGDLVGATNNYGYYGAIVAGTGRWNLYMDGTASNYLAGTLSIGNTAPAAGQNLVITKSLTGATATYSVLVNGTAQSDVTSSATGVRSSISTAAAAFTVPELMHFLVMQGTIGAGSTVTTQVGFSVASSLTGGTNNYAFRGTIAAGTGRYNLYMNGDAANYLAGKTGIGVVPSVATLEVRAGALGGNLNDIVEIFKFASTNSNLSSLTLTEIRHTAGTTYTTASTRLQHKVDATATGYIEWNPINGTQGLALGVGAGEAMRITPSKLIGIGTSTPAALLHLESASAYQPQIILRNTTSDANGGYWNSEKSRNGGAVVTNDNLGTFVFRGATADGLFRNAGYIQCTAQTIGSTFIGSKFRLFTVNSSGVGNNNLVLSENGFVTINGYAEPTSPLQVQGLPTYVDNTAALAGGLTAGAFYRTAIGVLMVVF